MFSKSNQFGKLEFKLNDPSGESISDLLKTLENTAQLHTLKITWAYDSIEFSNILKLLGLVKKIRGLNEFTLSLRCTKRISDLVLDNQMQASLIDLLTYFLSSTLTTFHLELSLDYVSGEFIKKIEKIMVLASHDNRCPENVDIKIGALHHFMIERVFLSDEAYLENENRRLESEQKRLR